MSADPVRFGIVGIGAIARHHINAATHIPDIATISALCDSNPAAIETAKAEFPGFAAYDSIDAMLDSGTIDAAIIATPHAMHIEQASRLVSQQIPVLVEKPLAISVAELRELRTLAEANNTLVVAGQMHRFDRVNVLARRWMEDDPDWFGHLESFSMECWQDLEEYTAKVGTSHWLTDGRIAGGGVVISLAIHQLDLVRYLGNADYVSVEAAGNARPPFHHGAESHASILVTMSNGASGTIFASYTAPRAFSSESFTLFGSHGGLGRHCRALGEYLGPLLWASKHDRDTVANLSELADRPDCPRVRDLLPDRFANQLAHMARAIRGEVEPINTIAENFNTIACIEAVYESLQAGGAKTLVRS